MLAEKLGVAAEASQVREGAAGGWGGGAGARDHGRGGRPRGARARARRALFAAPAAPAQVREMLKQAFGEDATSKVQGVIQKVRRGARPPPLWGLERPERGGRRRRGPRPNPVPRARARARAQVGDAVLDAVGQVQAAAAAPEGVSQKGMGSLLGGLAAQLAATAIESIAEAAANQPPPPQQQQQACAAPPGEPLPDKCARAHAARCVCAARAAAGCRPLPHALLQLLLPPLLLRARAAREREHAPTPPTLPPPPAASACSSRAASRTRRAPTRTRRASPRRRLARSPTR